MESELFSGYYLIRDILTAAFAATAIMWTARLIKSLAFSYRTKCTYHGFWVLPYTMFLIAPGLPDGYISWSYFVLMLGLWIFSLYCAMILSLHSVKTLQNWMPEAVMRHIIQDIDRLKRLLSVPGAAWSYISDVSLGVLGISALAVSILLSHFQKAVFLSYIIVIIFAAVCVISFCFSLYQCIFSCRALLLFWSLYGTLMAGLLTLFLAYMVLHNIISAFPFIAYGLICFAMTIFWCLSAGVADYDVAKMAGTIVNTGTTILLIAVNIFFGTIQRDVQLDVFSHYLSPEDMIYIANLVIFPFVVSGYLAVLFADGIEYWRKRHPAPVFKDEEPADETE